MKIAKALSDALKKRIVVNAAGHPNDLVQYCVENLSLSRNTVVKYINDLIQDGSLLRSNKGRYPRYSLPAETRRFVFRTSKDLTEERAIERLLPFVGELPPSASQIFDYAFMEIMNNAIEHSKARTIRVAAEKNAARIKIAIFDDGVGIFKKIKADLKLQNERQALIELSKGKFTSSPQNHSGEGIFFSSKLCDRFCILSDGLIFSPQEAGKEILREQKFAKGTKVIFEILLDTKKMAKEIFDEYAGGDFENPQFKTAVQMRFMQEEGLALTSRSQARRLLARLEKFTTVELDFSGVDFIGQAFADEIFRVYSKKNPGTKIAAKNESAQIRAAISHVQSQA